MLVKAPPLPKFSSVQTRSNIISVYLVKGAGLNWRDLAKISFTSSYQIPRFADFRQRNESIRSVQAPGIIPGVPKSIHQTSLKEGLAHRETDEPEPFRAEPQRSRARPAFSTDIRCELLP
jgi:hypothetical protein